MKYLKMLVLAVAIVLSGCSSLGPKANDLDTMNKKLHYAHTQITGIIEEANKLYLAGIIVEGTELYKGVDALIQESYKVYTQMKAATSLAEMIQLEADALSIVSNLRTILIEVAKQSGEPHAQRDQSIRFAGFSPVY